MCIEDARATSFIEWGRAVALRFYRSCVVADVGMDGDVFLFITLTTTSIFSLNFLPLPSKASDASRVVGVCVCCLRSRDSSNIQRRPVTYPPSARLGLQPLTHAPRALLAYIISTQGTRTHLSIHPSTTIPSPPLRRRNRGQGPTSHPNFHLPKHLRAFSAEYGRWIR